MNPRKDDKSKPMIAIVDEYFPDALSGVTAVCEEGMCKYGRGTWKGISNPLERYRNAMRRHQLAKASGEKVDTETGLPHSWHIAWNAMAIAQIEFDLDLIN